MKRSRGFTLLELLVVLLIVGILAAIGVYSLSITRAMNRDTKRVSDISVLRASLSQFWLQKATYPQADPVDLGRPGANADRIANSGLVAANVQDSPTFLDAVPTGPKAGEYYRYHGSAHGYSIRFITERPTAYGAAGTWYAHSDGVDHEDSEK